MGVTLNKGGVEPLYIEDTPIAILRTLIKHSLEMSQTVLYNTEFTPETRTPLCNQDT